MRCRTFLSFFRPHFLACLSPTLFQFGKVENGLRVDLLVCLFVCKKARVQVGTARQNLLNACFPILLLLATRRREVIQAMMGATSLKHTLIFATCDPFFPKLFYCCLQKQGSCRACSSATSTLVICPTWSPLNLENQLAKVEVVIGF